MCNTVYKLSYFTFSVLYLFYGVVMPAVFNMDEAVADSLLRARRAVGDGTESMVEDNRAQTEATNRAGTVALQAEGGIVDKTKDAIMAQIDKLPCEYFRVYK